MADRKLWTGKWFGFVLLPRRSLIFIGTQQLELAKYLKQQLKELGAEVRVASPKDKDFLKVLYNSEVSAVVADENLFGLPFEVSVDILNSLAQRLPVVVLADDRVDASANRQYLSDQLTIVSPNKKNEILTALGVLGSLENTNFKSYCNAVPYFNVQIPINQLKEHKGLGIISIDASGFSRVGLEYGIDVYTRLKEVFQGILFNLWGEVGSFREADILCRKSFASNVYYLFLSHSRETGSLPYPGALEQVADRLIANIQYYGIFSPKERRILNLNLFELRGQQTPGVDKAFRGITHTLGRGLRGEALPALW